MYSIVCIGLITRLKHFPTTECALISQNDWAIIADLRVGADDVFFFAGYANC